VGSTAPDLRLYAHMTMDITHQLITHIAEACVYREGHRCMCGETSRQSTHDFGSSEMLGVDIHNCCSLACWYCVGLGVFELVSGKFECSLVDVVLGLSV
jgi:hypothetical protein